MPAGAVATRGFSTGPAFQPGVKYIAARGFIGDGSVLSAPAAPEAKNGKTLGGRELNHKWNDRRKQDDIEIVEFIAKFMDTI